MNSIFAGLFLVLKKYQPDEGKIVETVYPLQTALVYKIIPAKHSWFVTTYAQARRTTLEQQKQ